MRVIQPLETTEDGPIDLEHHLHDGYPDSDDYGDYSVFAISPITSAEKKKPTITLCLAGQTYDSFLVDTGSCVTLMSQGMVHDLFGA